MSRRVRPHRRASGLRCATGDLCDGEAVILGFCNPHYKRWKRHGFLYSPKKVARVLKGDELERARRYYAEHREERLAYQRSRRLADPEAARAYERKVYRGRQAKHQAANRARMRGMEPLDADSLDFEAILRCDPCCYCGKAMKHIDHIDPVAHGGRNHWENLTAACQPCNRSKSDKPLLRVLLRS